MLAGFIYVFHRLHFFILLALTVMTLLSTSYHGRCQSFKRWYFEDSANWLHLKWNFLGTKEHWFFHLIWVVRLTSMNNTQVLSLLVNCGLIYTGEYYLSTIVLVTKLLFKLSKSKESLDICTDQPFKCRIHSQTTSEVISRLQGWTLWFFFQSYFGQPSTDVAVWREDPVCYRYNSLWILQRISVRIWHSGFIIPTEAYIYIS